MDITQPPSSFTGPLAQWAQSVTRVIQAIPQVSYITQVSPEGVINGQTGDQVITVGSTSTLTVLWLKASQPGVVSTVSWVKVSIVP